MLKFFMNPPQNTLKIYAYLMTFKVEHFMIWSTPVGMELIEGFKMKKFVEIFYFYIAKITLNYNH